MDKLTAIVVLLPSLLSAFVSLTYAYLAYKRDKEHPKDEVWDTTARLLCSSDDEKTADDFAELYIELKFFKENGCSLNGFHTVRQAIEAQNKQSAQQPGED